jgi:hypothetical protein
MTIWAVISLATGSAPAAMPVNTEINTHQLPGTPFIPDPARLRQAMEETHLAARIERSVAPLSWDKGLAEDAARWAKMLADRNHFGHDPQSDREKPQGENLWMGTRGAFPETFMVGRWIEERSLFRGGRFPDVTRAGTPWAKVGHYTQIIWPSTRSFGCALASNRDFDFLVCRYWPAGNIFGEPL